VATSALGGGWASGNQGLRESFAACHPPSRPEERVMTQIQDLGEKVAANVERVIIGKRQEVRLTSLRCCAAAIS